MLVQNIYALEEGFQLLDVFIFHTLREKLDLNVCAVCTFCVTDLWPAFQCICGVCAFESIKSNLSCQTLSQLGPKSCHPYQWLLHIHPTAEHSSGGGMAVGGVQLFIILQIKMSLGATLKLLTCFECPLLIACS